MRQRCVLPRLDERLSFEHPLLDLRNNISSVIFPNKYNSSPSPSHSPGSPKSMDEINGRMWHIIQNNVSNG